MKNKYTFCRNDRTIKKYYVPICEYIVNAQFKTREITIRRGSEIIDTYSCYVSTNCDMSTRDIRNYTSKIHEVCIAFDVQTKYWYSIGQLTTEFFGENVEKMIEELKLLLGGD